MSDFLLWEDSDIDLKELLGEWTEYDGEVSSDSWSEDNTDTNAKRSKIEDGISRTEYKCPLCDKQYRSVSGFRGHMVKKHNKTDIKACNNKVSGGETSSTNAEATSNSEPKSAHRINFKSTTEKAFTRLLQQGIIKVKENKHHMSKFSKSGHVIISICQEVLQSEAVITDIEELIKAPYLDIMSVYGQFMSFELDQEMMWTKFHVMRTDIELCNKLQILVSNITNASSPHIQGFIQVMFTDLLEVILSEFTNNIEHKAGEVPFSEQDNSVLFYISGFLIKALSKKAIQQNNTLVKNVLEDLCFKSSDSSPPFLQKYKQWTEKVSRGGLKICGDNFFFTVRKMEAICREKVDINTLSSTSIMKSELMEAILEDVTVQYYFHKLVPCVCAEKLKALILENIVSLFLKVRGNAVVKLVERRRQKTVQSAKKVVKKSNSLRKSLQRL